MLMMHPIVLGSGRRLFADGTRGFDSVQVRLMDEDDLQSAERASAVTFFEADRLSRRVGEPEIGPRAAAASTQWMDRMSHFLRVDPGGCRVARRTPTR
jgi:hypothetical protein